MNRKLLASLALATGLSAGALPAQGAVISLFDYGFNIDGTVSVPTLGDPVPAEVDLGMFDTITGLGTLTVSLVGTGLHSVDIFLDHEIDEAINTWFNESGDTSGVAAAGQSWEIDEPGWIFGDIFTNFTASTLDNTNGVPAGLEDDVSMAMGWDFTLGVDETASISFIVSETAPLSGFYLSHTDPDSRASIYLASTLNISTGQAPEPGTLLLIGAGLLGLGAFRRRS